jgi:hypothetical protein
MPLLNLVQPFHVDLGQKRLESTGLEPAHARAPSRKLRGLKTRKNGGDPLGSPPLFSPTEARLFLHRFVQSLHGVTHVLTSFLQVVEFLLLVRREQRTDLRHRFVDDRMRLLHRVLVNGDDLRPGLIDERLNFCLLIRREVQRLGQMSQRKSLAMAVPSAAGSAPVAIFGLDNGEAAERDRAYGGECKQVSFHSLFLFWLTSKMFGVVS